MMEPMWGVIYGSLIGGLILELIRLAKGHIIKKESKAYAITSIVCGFMIIIPFISIPGLVLGVISFRKTKWKKLSMTGIITCSLATILYGLVLLGKYSH